MAIIRIENFGGELPSVSPRALPANAAQVNSNLYLATSEFRPLKTDSTAATTASGTKTLHRFARKADGSYNADTTTGWITSTGERSYVKGQIDDERTERTYYTFDDGSAAPRACDVNGADRLLGVPSPVKPTVTANISDETTVEEAVNFSYDDAAPAIRTAISQSKWPDGVTGHYSGSTPLAGVYSLHGLLLHSNADISSLYGSEWWSLYAKVSKADLDRLAISFSGVRGKPTSDGLHWVLPIFSLPYRYYFVEATLRTNLAGVMSLDGVTPLLSQENIDTIVGSATGIMDPNSYAGPQRSDLDKVVVEFAQKLAEIAQGVTPPTDPVELAAFNESERTRGQNLFQRINELCDQAETLTREIERLGALKWAYITDVTSEITSLVGAVGGVAGLFPDAVTRIVDTRFYVVTAVTDWGEESAPSPVSDMLEIDQNDSATVSLPALPNAQTFASRNIQKWRIYRSNTGSQQTAFQFVDELPIATTSYTDTKKGAELGELMPTLTWLEPPYRADASSELTPLPTSGSNPYLRGLVGMPNGIMAGFFDNTVAFCEPYAPYAWPVEYQISTEFPIVGLGVFGQTLFVGTTGNPYLISGADSASMSAQKMDVSQACSSRRSIASVPGGVLFASPDGLCVADQNGVNVVSLGMFTREDWQALDPTTMLAAAHESIYYLFYAGSGGGCLTFDLASKKLGRVNLTATAAFTDKLTDTLFLASGTSIQAVFGGATRRTGQWKSGKLTLAAQATFAWLKVYGDQTAEAPATVKLYGDGQLRHTATVSSANPVRLPPGRWLEYEVEVSSQSRLTKIMLASSTQELQSL